MQAAVEEGVAVHRESEMTRAVNLRITSILVFQQNMQNHIRYFIHQTFLVFYLIKSQNVYSVLQKGIIKLVPTPNICCCCFFLHV